MDTTSQCSSELLILLIPYLIMYYYLVQIGEFKVVDSKKRTNIELFTIVWLGNAALPSFWNVSHITWHVNTANE